MFKCHADLNTFHSSVNKIFAHVMTVQLFTTVSIMYVFYDSLTYIKLVNFRLVGNIVYNKACETERQFSFFFVMQEVNQICTQ